MHGKVYGDGSLIGKIHADKKVPSRKFMAQRRLWNFSPRGMVVIFGIIFFIVILVAIIGGR